MDAQKEHNEGADMDWPYSLLSLIFGRDLSVPCGQNPLCLVPLNTAVTTIHFIRQAVSNTPLQAANHFSSTIFYFSVENLCLNNRKIKMKLKSFNLVWSQFRQAPRL